MTYDEAIKATVSRREAVREYEDHGLTETDLVSDHGAHANYRGAAILAALGY